MRRTSAESAVIHCSRCQSASDPLRDSDLSAPYTDSSSKQRHSVGHDRSRLQTVNVAGHTLQAVSVGATETCVISSHLAFDIGRCPLQAVRMRVVAFTHMHVDHVGGVAFHAATRNMQKLPPPIYIVPEAAESAFRNLLHAYELVDGTKYNFSVIPLKHGEDFVVKKGWILRSFPTRHTVPSQGYILYEVRKKLLSRYRDLSVPELVACKKRGETLQELLLIPQIAVTGDTTLDAIEACVDARRARALVTEVTFLDDSCTAKDARSRGHVHIDELCQREHIFSENEGVLFTHFSARYSSSQISALLRTKISSTLQAKSIPLLGGDRNL